MDLDVEPSAEGITRVRVSGDVIMADYVPTEEPLAKRLGEDCYRGPLLMDLSGVSMLDSSGVRWLLICQKRFRLAGGTLVLHSLSPTVRPLFDLLKIHIVLTVAADERAALEIAKRGRA